MTTAILPWPPKELSPNSRKDRRGTTSIRKQYKNDCWVAAKEAKLRPSQHLHIVFHPPKGGRRDLDNMLGAIKYGLDGVALAMGMDDSEWSLTIVKGEPIRPHGEVHISTDETWQHCADAAANLIRNAVERNAG